jgi:hypothetical protein
VKIPALEQAHSEAVEGFTYFLRRSFMAREDKSRSEMTHLSASAD